MTRSRNIAPLILWEGVFRVGNGPQGPFLETPSPGGRKLVLPLHLAINPPPKGVYGFGGGKVEEGLAGKKIAPTFVLKFFYPAQETPMVGGVWLSGIFDVKEVKEGEALLSLGGASIKGYHRMGRVGGRAYVRGKVGGFGRPVLLIDYLFHLEPEVEEKEVILPLELPF